MSQGTFFFRRDAQIRKSPPDVFVYISSMAVFVTFVHSQGVKIGTYYGDGTFCLTVLYYCHRKKQEIFTDGYRNSIIRILQWISAYHMKKYNFI